MGYGISYANAPGVGEQTYIGRPPFGDVIDTQWFKQSLYLNFTFIFRVYFDKCEDF